MPPAPLRSYRYNSSMLSAETMALDDLTPMRKTIIAFCILMALGFARTLPAMHRFYQWFLTCGLEISQFRGFGQSACKAYGFIPNPPPLTMSAFTICGALLVGSLILSCTDVAPKCCLVAALVLYWVYMAQLYCEAHVGAHVTVLFPPMLLIAVFSPGLTASSAEVPVAAQMLPLFVLKAVITSAYCSAGISKLWASIKNGVFWGNGSTLQYYCFEALFINREQSPHGAGVPHYSFGVPSPYSYHLQRFLFRSPRLCAVLSMKSLMFEAAAPVVIFYPHLGPLFAIAGVGFHYGIALFQNIDFFSWWGPFYILFAFEDPMVTADISGMIGASFSSYPVATVCMVGYLVLHILAMPYAMVTGHEILPFSSFHMFSEPKNLWDPSKSKSWWLSTKEHATGTLKNYSFPFARKQHVTVEELPHLPFKYLFVGTAAGKNTEFGNVQVSTKLRELVTKMHQEWCLGAEHYLNAESIERMLALLEAAKGEFGANVKKLSASKTDVRVAEPVSNAAHDAASASSTKHGSYLPYGAVAL